MLSFQNFDSIWSIVFQLSIAIEKSDATLIPNYLFGRCFFLEYFGIFSLSLVSWNFIVGLFFFLLESHVFNFWEISLNFLNI